jgi:hypothetical protein
MTIYESILNWLQDCPEMDNYIYFNVIPLDTNSSSVSSNSNVPNSVEYIDGTKLISLPFNIDLIRDYDAGGTSDINMEAIQSFNKLTEWIKLQNAIRNLPVKEGCDIFEVGVTDSSPTIYIDTTDNSRARYQNDFYIQYLERN